MKIGALIEVGVAVDDLAAASCTFTSLLGARATSTIRASMFSMDFRMCRVGRGVDFELMTPYAADSVIGRFLSRRGEGLHHVAFHVLDIDDTISQCRARGLTVLPDEPVAIGRLRAAFLHPGCLSGLLVEFVENLHDWGAVAADPACAPEPDVAIVAGFGVAVGDVDTAASQYASILGAQVSDPRWNERLGAHVRHALVSGIRFELLPSTASRIGSARLDGDGQGLHHVCLRVGRPEAFAAVRERSATRGGADDGGIFSTDPAACHGVMLEIHAVGQGPFASVDP